MMEKFLFSFSLSLWNLADETSRLKLSRNCLRRANLQVPSSSHPPFLFVLAFSFELLSCERTHFYLEFSLDLFVIFDDLSLTLKISAAAMDRLPLLPPAIEHFLHRFTCRIYVGLKIGFFKVQFTSLHQPWPDTRPSSIITSVPAFGWTPLRLISTATPQGVVLTCRCMVPRAAFAEASPLQLLRFEFFLLFCVTFSNFLWLCCLVLIPIRLVFRLFIWGLDLLYFSFWFLFENFFFHSYLSSKSPWLFRKPVQMFDRGIWYYY